MYFFDLLKIEFL